MALAYSSSTKGYMALTIVCLVWGTTYFSIKIGVESFPAFLFSGIRHGSSGLIMLIGLKLIGKLNYMSKSDLFHQSVLGILMVALGNGIIAWCERDIPSGLAALIVSVIPVFVVLINYVSGIDRKKSHPLVFAGLFFGCTGIVLIFKDNLKDLAYAPYRNSLIWAFSACFSLALGAVYSKAATGAKSSGNILQNSAIQLLSGGVTLLLISLLFDDYSELRSVKIHAIWALLYLIFFGSILAYSCFVYALKALPLGVSSLYAYINPFVAFILGYFLLNEPFSEFTAFALFSALIGIYCINKGYIESAKYSRGMEK